MAKHIEPIRILLVDDDHDILNSLKNGLDLGALSYVLETASSGEEAIEKVVSYKPHIIVLDLFMPDRDGFSVLQYIRSDLSLTNTRVIMLTAADTQKNKWESMFLEADDFIGKPFDLYELESLISYHAQGITKKST